MLRWREASNKAALSFSRPALRRWADFAVQPRSSRSGAEFFSERSATVQGSAECARSLFLVLKAMESEEDSLKRILDVRQPAASAERSSWEKYRRALTSGEKEQTECRFHEPATGSEQSRAVSHLAPTAS